MLEVPQTGGDAIGEGGEAFFDELEIVVEGGHVVRALERELRDVFAAEGAQNRFLSFRGGTLWSARE